MDHAGASFEYGECYVNPADVALLYEHGDIDKRYGFVMGGGKPEGAFVPKKEDVVPPCAVKTLPVQDGDVFDLGGVQIEAIAVPGHTAGTMVYLDRARRVLYSGDACNANTLLGLPCSTTVETYAKSLDHLATYLKGIDKFYGGHGLQAVPAYIVDEAMILCEEILSDDDDRFETEGYRKALRLMKQAEKFHRPVICFVDTSGAFCGIGAEERGQGQAIAENLVEMIGLKTPVISILVGEGGSGGALALAVADRVWILENAVYSVVSPEGCASILWKDAKKAKEAAECLHLTAQDMEKLGVVERVISESGKTKAELFSRVKEMLAVQTDELCKKDTETLLKERYERFRKY